MKDEIYEMHLKKMLSDRVTFNDWKMFRSYFENLPEEVAKERRLDFIICAIHAASFLDFEEVYSDDILLHVVIGLLDFLNKQVNFELTCFFRKFLSIKNNKIKLTNYIFVSFITVEQVAGIEPAQPAWKAGILPLNYTCDIQF